MAQTIDYELPAKVGGGKLTGFTYSRSLGELIGSWSATVVGGSFRAGRDFSLKDCMERGVIERVWTDPDGVTHMSGKDAGVRLMRSTPHASGLPGGGTAAVIVGLAGYCDVDCSVDVSLGGFDARSAVTGGSCGEAILELALLAGCIAYISPQGKLVVTPPERKEPDFDVILDDSGTEIDLDGYATRATVVVTRRKMGLKEEGGTVQVHYKGRTHDGRVTWKTDSGEFAYLDAEGKEVSGAWSVTTEEPVGAIKSSTRSVTRDGVTVTVEEEHDNRILSRKRWRGDQEYTLFAWAEAGYTVVKTTEGTYKNAAGGRGLLQRGDDGGDEAEILHLRLPDAPGGVAGRAGCGANPGDGGQRGDNAADGA